MQYATQSELFYLVSNCYCSFFLWILKEYRNDGSCNIFCIINDLVDSWNTLCDIHAGNTCKVKSFKSHLCSRFSNTLCSKSSNRFTRLYDSSINPLNIYIKEKFHVLISNTMKTISNIFLITFIFTRKPLIIFAQVISLYLEILL